MKKKRIYRATPVKQVRLEALMQAVGEKRVIVGIDIAKEDMFAGFESDGAVALTVRWKHPEQTLGFAELLTVVNLRMCVLAGNSASAKTKTLARAALRPNPAS